MVVDRPSAWVQLPDQVNMHYRLYSEDLQHLPVLLLLSPTMLHLGFYAEYFNDEWLRENFTIVAFDTRHHGKTTAVSLPFSDQPRRPAQYLCLTSRSHCQLLEITMWCVSVPFDLRPST